MKKFLKNNAVQSLIASLICIVLGLLIGYIVLLFINPAGASEAILAVIKNFWNYSRANLQLKNFGSTLVKTAPLLMCALSVLFAYKVGLFNIGAAGQYVVGACACLFAALAWGWSWLPCLLFAMVVGALYGAIVGLLKSFCNVNEVISGIMLNWIGLYTTNMILANVKESTSPYTVHLKNAAPQAMLPTLGLEELFNNKNVTIAVPLAVLTAVIILIILDKTRLGYELKATWYADGTEVVFACGGGIYTSAVDAAKKVDGKVIGVDVDQAGVIQNYAEAEDTSMTVTSAMKGLAATVNTELAAVLDGSFEGGKVENLGLVSEVPEENYVQLAGSTQFSDDFTVEDYTALVGAMLKGEIVVNNDITISAADNATVVTVNDLGNIK